MTLPLNNSNKDFKFVGRVIKTSWLIYFRQCKVSLCERNTHDGISVGENCCSILAQKTTDEKNLGQDLLRNENTDSDLKASARAALCK